MELAGELIASGRDANIFECGSGRVLRRSRNGRSMASEAKTMHYVRAQGYPCPEVFDVSDDGLDLVMQRVDGPTMVDAAGSRPLKVRSLARSLAKLHSSLHTIAAPEWLHDAPFGTGDRLLHMDLHPLNVLMSKDGPVVIDWPNAARGNPSVDVAVTWILMSAGQLAFAGIKSAIVSVGRKVMLETFLSAFDRDDVRLMLNDAVAWKSQDPNMSATEMERMHSLASTA
jgi:aminoglycoside phosphotransferase (APT) family kinase protein